MPAILSAFSGETTSSGLSVLMILAKATVVLLAALGVTRAMERGSAVSRHLVWFVSLGALLLIPLLASWSPIRLAILPSDTAAPALGAPTSAGPTTLGVRSAAPTAAPQVAGPGSPISSPRVESAATTVRDIVSPQTPWFGILSDPTLLFGIWATVALLFAGWLGFGALSVRRIIRRARPLESQDWMNPLWEVADRLELDSAPRLVRSDDAKMPFACGLLRPTIVLPAESDSWTLDRRRAVLLHELAHVRRRDLVGHTVGRFACALYWFHPLVWTAAKRLRSESERACDDLALNCGARASDYAEHLLDIVTGVRHHATPAVALAMARRKEFEGRMLAILDPELRRGAPSRRQTVGLVGGLAVLSLVVGAAVPVARAADGSVRPNRGASMATAAAADTPSFLDEEMSQAVRTMERKETRQQTSRRVDTVHIQNELGTAIGTAVGTAVGTSVSKTVGKSVGEIVSSTVRDVVPAAINAAVPSVEALTAAISAPNAKQGRNDDRPALLANVLKTDTSATLRRVAAWGLAQFGESQVGVDALTQAVRRDKDATVRETAAWALADARSSTAVIEALSAALKSDTDAKVRATAAWALGSLGDDDGVPALTAALSDTSRAIRLRSVWAIGSISPKQAPKPLVALLSDKDEEMRQMVAWALFTIQDPDAVPALTTAMRSETDKDTQRALIRALAATGEQSVDAIKALIDSKDPEVREAAIRALAGGRASGPWPKPWPQPRPHPY
ncbi:MAG TPA: HEAT repeat domain-containing protein [Gemmatimonadaceae bacterium]|nr:HEAT repeat domain-containing protein [Gemmatimonadaceae bacterium]